MQCKIIDFGFIYSNFIVMYKLRFKCINSTTRVSGVCVKWSCTCTRDHRPMRGKVVARLQCDWSTRADKLFVVLFLVLMKIHDLKMDFYY